MYPCTEEPFLLDTDASNVSIGAVKSRVHNGEKQVMVYYSHALNKREFNFCSTRPERLAVVKAIENFHPYLYERQFTVRTDHTSLQWLLTFKNPEGQMARWLRETADLQLSYQVSGGQRSSECRRVVTMSLFQNKLHTLSMPGGEGVSKCPRQQAK